MSDRTEAVSVTLPAADLDQVREIVRAGGARSVSAFLADALHDRLTREQRAERATTLLHKFFGDPFDGTPEENAKVEAWLEHARTVAAANWTRAHRADPTTA